MRLGRGRIKRRVLRELVAQNVELIRGGWPGRRRRGWRRLRAAARLFLFVLAPAGLLAPSYLTAPERGSSGSVAAVTAGVAGAVLETRLPLAVVAALLAAAVS